MFDRVFMERKIISTINRTFFMKMIRAMVGSKYLHDIQKSLAEKLELYGGTFIDTKGRGRKHCAETCLPNCHHCDPIPNVTMEIVVPDNLKDAAVQVILDVVRKGDRHGLGKIFISTVEEAISIRTGKRGEEAIM